MADVQKVRNKKGGLLVATFDGSRRLRVYTVKDKHLKKLGIGTARAATVGKLRNQLAAQKTNAP